MVIIIYYFYVVGEVFARQEEMAAARSGRWVGVLSDVEEVEVIPGPGIRTGISSTTVGLLHTAAATQLGNIQQTADSRQQTADSRQQTAGSRQ